MARMLIVARCALRFHGRCVSNKALAPLRRHAKAVLALDACTALRDAGGEVLSLPPLTNCYASRTTTATRAVLLEASSATSADACRRMLLALIRLIQAESTDPPPFSV